MGWTIDDYDRRADYLEYQRIKARFPELVTRAFECNGGWYPMLERMFADIDEAIPAGRKGEFQLRQIKEKHGGARVYWDFATQRGDRYSVDAPILEKIMAAVTLAEFRAERTCDICGSRGWPLVRGGWHMTRCMAHAEGGLPRGEPETRMWGYDYDEATDMVRLTKNLTIIQHLKAKAEELGEEIEMVLVGNLHGMSIEFDRLAWPGWDDPMPRHLRGKPVPWSDVSKHLGYPIARHEGAFHPVTAWTKSWVLMVHKDYNWQPVVIAVPRQPQEHHQEYRP
jgi:hypothetical protein